MQKNKQYVKEQLLRSIRNLKKKINFTEVEIERAYECERSPQRPQSDWEFKKKRATKRSELGLLWRVYRSWERTRKSHLCSDHNESFVRVGYGPERFLGPVKSEIFNNCISAFGLS